MKIRNLVLAAAAATLLSVAGIAAPATAAPNNCPAFDTGLITDVPNNYVVAIEAPEGERFSAVCIKISGQDPIIRNFPNGQILTFFYPQGKKVAHYSVDYIE